jgi:calcineurin-like phosphoesterase family protein
MFKTTREFIEFVEDNINTELAIPSKNFNDLLDDKDKLNYWACIDINRSDNKYKEAREFDISSVITTNKELVDKLIELHDKAGDTGRAEFWKYVSEHLDLEEFEEKIDYKRWCINSSNDSNNDSEVEDLRQQVECLKKELEECKNNKSVAEATMEVCRKVRDVIRE